VKPNQHTSKVTSILGQLVVPTQHGPLKPRPGTACRTDQVIPCQHVGPHPKPKHGLIIVTRVMSGRWPIRPIVMGQPRLDCCRRPPLGLTQNTLPSRFGAATHRIRRAQSCTDTSESKEDEIQSDSVLSEKKVAVTCRRRKMMRFIQVWLVEEEGCDLESEEDDIGSGPTRRGREGCGHMSEEGDIGSSPTQWRRRARARIRGGRDRVQSSAAEKAMTDEHTEEGTSARRRRVR
jgi:hypothetical protein